MSNALQLNHLPSGVVVVTMDLPDSKINLLSESMMRELDVILDQVLADKSTKGFVLASAKTDSFVAGARNSSAAESARNQVLRGFEYGQSDHG